MATDVGDRDGLKGVLTRYFAPGVPRLRKLWVDGSYTGAEIKAWVASLLHPDFRRDKRRTKIDLDMP